MSSSDNNVMLAQSVSARYAFSIGSTGLRGLSNLLAAALLARWLGPESYGVLAYLVAVLTVVRELTDLTASSAFFTFISKQRYSRIFISRYWLWIAGQFAVCYLLIGFIIPDKLLYSLAPDIDRALILFALTAIFSHSQVWLNMNNMAEAKRLSILAQSINTTIAFLHLLVIFVLYLFDSLMLEWIFLAMSIEWIFASLCLAIYLKKISEHDVESICNDCDSSGEQFQKFWVYCAPYIPYTVIGAICVFLDRWLLQAWSGSEQQAHFAIAQQLSLITLLLTTSLLKIFWKEAASLYHSHDSDKLERFYNLTLRRLYFIGSLFFCILIPWAEEILFLFFGEIYLVGASVFFLMLFYPVHQSLGQIMITILHATEKSRLQVLLGISFMLTGLIFAYIMMAPRSSLVPGLGLGALGLALKMVVLQVLQINVMGWFLARSLNWRHHWAYQITHLLPLVTLTFLFKFIVLDVLGLPEMLAMALSIFLFLMSAAILVIAFPSLINVTRGQILKVIKF